MNSRIGPLPEHYYPPHRRVNVDYIIERARRIVPEFGGRDAMNDDQVAQLVAGARIRIVRTPMGGSCPAFLTPPIDDKHYMAMDEALEGSLARAVQLHEVAHALGGHFGPGYVDSTPGARTSLELYDTWEREADLFAAIGYLTAAERRRPVARIRTLLLERIPIHDDEWVRVRAPWVARALVRRYSARNGKAA